jgi:hypothetical protein
LVVGEELERRAGFCHAAVELGECLLNLYATPLVRGGRKLALELGAGQSQRFERLHALRIPDGARLPLGPCPLHLVDAFLNARLGVDQPFARITHGASLL